MHQPRPKSTSLQVRLRFGLSLETDTKNDVFSDIVEIASIGAIKFDLKFRCWRSNGIQQRSLCSRYA